MRFAVLTCAAMFVSAVSCGCGGTGQPYVTPGRLDRGLVIVLTGIHGRLWLSDSICRGLDKGGVSQAIEVYDWTYHGHWLPFYNLGAIERNHEQAKRIAQHVEDYRRDHPGRPVTLVGYSGGGPLAIWTAEQMSSQPLEGMVLLSTPLVPEYDLRPALSASRKGIVSFYSQDDVLYLGVGTVLFGTMDKQHCVSAGNVGFKYPRGEHGASAASKPADPYDRLYQVPYNSEMGYYGYHGSHLTIGAEKFIAAYVAPLVKSSQWDNRLLDDLPKPPPMTWTP